MTMAKAKAKAQLIASVTIGTDAGATIDHNIYDNDTMIINVTSSQLGAWTGTSRLYPIPAWLTDMARTVDENTLKSQILAMCFWSRPHTKILRNGRHVR